MRRRQKHASEISKVGILLEQGTVLETKFMGLGGSCCHLAFELADIFYIISI